jgi:predicted nuclease with RNAse H fold
VILTISEMSTSTLGIDLAAESRNTAVCRVRWETGTATVEAVQLGSRTEPLDNQALSKLIARADATGIDAPFGWPRRFVAAVSAWSETSTWPERWDTEARPALRLRATDRWLQERQGRAPLSVSADSIGVCAMRAATLLQLTAGGSVNRVDGPTYEVYPAAALRAWKFATKDYKKVRSVRTQLLNLVAGEWLTLGTHADELTRTDHTLDALISAIAARAASLRRTETVPSHLRAEAEIEGWIHVPTVMPWDLID